jgi:glycosyltransferase involved in cell wall biosynthesis
LTLPALIWLLIKQRKNKRQVIFRIPGILSLLYQVFALPRGHQYAAEVVGDPADVFSENASKSTLRPLLRYSFMKMLAWQCKNACAISYVTEVSLQRRYPPNTTAFHTHYSSIQLAKTDYCQREKYPLMLVEQNKILKIICIGTLSQPYKGCDFMLHTLAKMKANNYLFSLTWLGGGALLDEMAQLAQSLGISEHVNFIGNVSERAQISAQLDLADVFVLCSRQEGLPRVVIEAMARSLVCIATNVGGVPELLNAEQIIERDNVEQLSNKLAELYNLTETQLLAMANTNYTKALQYENSVLAARRKQMYQALLST